MRQIGLILLTFVLTLSCDNKPGPGTNSSTSINLSENTADTLQIKQLVRQTLIWADSKNSIDLLPVFTDDKDSVYVGLDLNKHKQNLIKLKESNFFSAEFIDNYNKIILKLDNGLRTNKYEPWLVGELPTFGFANDASPWCNCQDNNDWNTVEIRTISLSQDRGEFDWYWGNLNQETHQSWRDFSYRFGVSKEDGKWKISEMEGFKLEGI